MKIKFYNPENDIIPLELHLIIDDKYHIKYYKDPEMKSKFHPAYIFDLELDNDLKFNHIQEIMKQIGQEIIKQSKNIEERWDLDSFEIININKTHCKFKLVFTRG